MIKLLWKRNETQLTFHTQPSYNRMVYIFIACAKPGSFAPYIPEDHLASMIDLKHVYLHFTGIVMYR